MNGYREADSPIVSKKPLNKTGDNKPVAEEVERRENGARRKKAPRQGGSISPLLANIYLHYVFDLWANSWRNRKASGDVAMVRFADDVILGFQYKHEAISFLEELKTRFMKFNLEVNAEKTSLIEFVRYAAERRKERGEGKPETFDFLGFTHICSISRKGKFMVLRKTSGKKMRNKLAELKKTMSKNGVKSTLDSCYYSRVKKGHVRAEIAMSVSWVWSRLNPFGISFGVIQRDKSVWSIWSISWISWIWSRLNRR